MRQTEDLYRYRTVLRLREVEAEVEKTVELPVPPSKLEDFVSRHNVSALEQFPLRPYIVGMPMFIGRA